MPRTTFLGLDAASGVALLLYRLGMGALDLAVLYLVAAALGSGQPWRGAAWLVVPALFAVQFPILQGRHVGAETLLLPWLGGTIALLHLGRAQARNLAFVALAGGAVSTLVKLEAALLFCALVLPWAVEALREEPRVGRRRTLLSLACVVAGLLPLLLWRFDLRVANPVYETPTLTAARSALPHLGPVFARCAQVLLRDPAALWILIALPLVWVSTVHAARGSRLAESIVPISVLGTLGGLPLVYLFSNLPRLAQIDVSFLRLALVPLWSAMFYVVSRASRRLPASAQASA